MMPEETVMAARDLQANWLLPVHWGKFNLSLHAWNEPIKRVVKAAQDAHQPILTPRIGELVIPGVKNAPDEWWNFT